MRYAFLGHNRDGRRRGGTLKFTMAEYVASTGLLLIAVGVTIAVLISEPLAIVPGITYAVAIGLAYAVYRHYLHLRSDDATTAGQGKVSEPLRMDVHPLLESGWEDQFATIATREWVDMPAATFPTATFRVVGSRGICPLGFAQGDFVEVAASGSVTPGLCPLAEAVLHMAADDDSEVREWCCPVYDHLLVFKKLEKIS